MSQAPPEPGDVIRHWYLWHDQASQGAEEGVKSRPCLVVRTDLNEHDETKVYVAPITTQPPNESTRMPTLSLPLLSSV